MMNKDYLNPQGNKYLDQRVIREIKQMNTALKQILRKYYDYNPIIIKLYTLFEIYVLSTFMKHLLRS